ncbi:MAG TPA: response regulator transcription factor [Clostridia bacterium]|nr:response regulator transcription factor [Clostridia bacterium]
MNQTEIKPIRLLIVDDHQVTRLGLRTLLGAFPQFEIVGEAGSVAETLDAVARLHPDLLLLDMRLSDGSGIDVCRHLQRLDLDTKVLVLTSFVDDALIFDAITAGADGYLLKEIHGDNLVQAIQDVAMGKSILDPAVTSRVLSRVRNPVEPAMQNKLDLLSAQERRVVALVAEGKTNKEIGREMGLSDKTVKNYLSNAMEKLDLSRRSQAAALFITQTQHAEGQSPRTRL